MATMTRVYESNGVVYDVDEYGRKRDIDFGTGVVNEMITGLPIALAIYAVLMGVAIWPFRMLRNILATKEEREVYREWDRSIKAKQGGSGVWGSIKTIALYSYMSVVVYVQIGKGLVLRIRDLVVWVKGKINEKKEVKRVVA
ncbi:MAG: hypothetical protein IJW18_03490 [Lachnospiraceae bacterium]|nr:hypothetical protein [Lachnospiraceae bacterium]